MGFALDELGPEGCKRIAEDLFKVEKDFSSRQVLHGFCPIHGDKTSASFAYNYGADWYKCQSCDAGGDLIMLWCHVHGLDSRGEGFKAFKEEFVGDTGDSSGPRSRGRRQAPKPVAKPAPAPEVFVPVEDLESLPPLPAERVTELRRTRGWSAQTIEDMDLRLFAPGYGEPRIAMPILDDGGRLGNIRLYQPGADQFKIISWYDRKCRQCGGSWKKVEKKKVCKECGANPTDYGRTRLYPPPSQWKPGLLWLVEGEPDMLCALSQGLNAVTQTAGCGTWPDEFSEAMAGRDVVIAYDADQAGHKGAMKAAESIAQHAKSVRYIEWPEVMGRA